MGTGDGSGLRGGCGKLLLMANFTLWALFFIIISFCPVLSCMCACFSHRIFSFFVTFFFLLQIDGPILCMDNLVDS